MRCSLTYRFNANQSMPSDARLLQHGLNRVTDLFGVRFRYLNLRLGGPCFMSSPRSESLHAGPRPPQSDGRGYGEIGRMAEPLSPDKDPTVLPREEVINTFKMVQVIRKNMEGRGLPMPLSPPVPMPAPPVGSTRSGAPCVLSHSLNNEMGLPSACEADITALICTAILMGVSGKAPYMSNTIRCKTDEEGMFPACPFLTKEGSGLCRRSG